MKKIDNCKKIFIGADFYRRLWEFRENLRSAIDKRLQNEYTRLKYEKKGKNYG